MDCSENADEYIAQQAIHIQQEVLNTVKYDDPDGPEQDQLNSEM